MRRAAYWVSPTVHHCEAPRLSISPPILAFLLSFTLMVALLPTPGHAEIFAATDKPEHPPLRCTGNQDLILKGRSIITSGDAVDLVGNCDVHIEDSVILADGYGVRVHANADVVIVNSFVEGRAGAVKLGGNGDIAYSGSTLRGAFGAPGIGELIDQGGNTVEVIPESTRSRTTPEPIYCDGRDTLRLVGQVLQGEAPMVVAGSCQVLISDSEVLARAVLEVRDRGSVRIRNSRLSGDVVLSGSAKVHAAGSVFEGSVKILDDSSLLDGGGNTGLRFGRSTSASRGAGDRAHGITRESSEGRGSMSRRAGRDSGVRVVGGGGLEEGLESLADTLGDLTGVAEDLADAVLEVPAPVSGRPWVGGWQVTSARLGQQILDAGGRVLLYEGGHGLSTLTVQLAGHTVPQIGTFGWRVSGQKLRVDPREGEPSVWRIVRGTGDLRTLKVFLDEGLEVELRLRRLYPD